MRLIYFQMVGLVGRSLCGDLHAEPLAEHRQPLRSPLPVGRLPATRRASLGQFIRIRHNMMSDKVGAPKTLGDTTPVEDVGDDGRKVMSVAYVKEGGVIETKNVYVDTPELVGFSTYEISEDGKTMKNTITSRNGISFTMAFVPAEAPTGWFS